MKHLKCQYSMWQKISSIWTRVIPCRAFRIYNAFLENTKTGNACYLPTQQKGSHNRDSLYKEKWEYQCIVQSIASAEHFLNEINSRVVNITICRADSYVTTYVKCLLPPACRANNVHILYLCNLGIRSCISNFVATEPPIKSAPMGPIYMLI